MTTTTSVPPPHICRAERNPLTPPMVTAIFSGLAILVAAVGGILVQLQAQERSAERSAVQQAEKLDKITILVDGTKSAMLRKIAVLMRNTADKSGLAKDIKMADEAEREADEQEARVQAAVDAAAKAKPQQEAN